MKLLFRSVRSFISQLSRKEGSSVMSPNLLIRLSGFVYLPQLLSPPTGIRHICRNEDEESSRIAREWNIMPRYRLRNSHWKLVILCKKKYSLHISTPDKIFTYIRFRFSYTNNSWKGSWFLIPCLDTSQILTRKKTSVTIILDTV